MVLKKREPDSGRYLASVDIYSAQKSNHVANEGDLNEELLLDRLNTKPWPSIYIFSVEFESQERGRLRAAIHVSTLAFHRMASAHSYSNHQRH